MDNDKSTPNNYIDGLWLPVATDLRWEMIPVGPGAVKWSVHHGCLILSQSGTIDVYLKDNTEFYTRSYGAGLQETEKAKAFFETVVASINARNDAIRVGVALEELYNMQAVAGSPVKFQ
jgi:hypothetical protein